MSYENSTFWPTYNSDKLIFEAILICMNKTTVQSSNVESSGIKAYSQLLPPP